MNAKLAALVLAGLLAGCAATPTSDPIAMVENGRRIDLKEKLKFPAVSTGGNEVHYHGLLPGTYQVEAQDSGGTYYKAAGKLIVFDASVGEGAKADEPTEFGGFWLAKNTDSTPAVRLYRYNVKSVDTTSAVPNVVGEPQGMRLAYGAPGGLFGALLVTGLVGAQSRGTGEWTWQFIPMNSAPEEAAKLRAATQ